VKRENTRLAKQGQTRRDELIAVMSKAPKSLAANPRMIADKGLLAGDLFCSISNGGGGVDSGPPSGKSEQARYIARRNPHVRR
jgi:hypothetical protein